MGTPWLAVPVGINAHRWVTRRREATVLVVVSSVVAGQRLMDVVDLIECDLRVQTVYTQGPGVFGNGVPELLRSLGVLRIPWQQAVQQRFDLVLAAAYEGLHELHGPIMVLPHGAGYGKRAPGFGGDSRPTYGLDAQRLIRDGRVLPASIVLSHESQRTVLARQCPPAAEVAVVSVEYRLAPEAPFPGGAQDVAAAVRWVRDHVSAYAGQGGADLSRMLLIGHSAGGSHVASYLCDPRVRPAMPEVAGAVLISARLRADVLPDNPNAPGVVAYYGEDPQRYGADAPTAHVDAMPVPAMVVIAEFENPHLDTYALEFCYRLALRDGRAPRFVQVRDHNHTSIVAHLDTGDDSLGREILQFLHEIDPSP